MGKQSSRERRTLDYLKAEAAQGRRGDFEHYLGKVPDVRAQEGDEAD